MDSQNSGLQLFPLMAAVPWFLFRSYILRYRLAWPHFRLPFPSLWLPALREKARVQLLLDAFSSRQEALTPIPSLYLATSLTSMQETPHARRETADPLSCTVCNLIKSYRMYLLLLHLAISTQTQGRLSSVLAHADWSPTSSRGFPAFYVGNLPIAQARELLVWAYPRTYAVFVVSTSPPPE